MYGALFWVGRGEGVSGVLFWVRGSGWDILVGWVWVGGALFWVGGGEWGWVHCLIMLFYKTSASFLFITETT